MLIGVVSDTHMYSRSRQLPKALTDGLHGVELIVHAGDWTDPEVIGLLEALAPVESVAGNNDGPAIVERFGRRKVLELAGRHIGLVHGDGWRAAPDTAFEAFRGASVDAVIFGHSHTPHLEQREGVLLFNPGSPTDKRREPRYSYGLLTLGSEIVAEHRYYDQK